MLQQKDLKVKQLEVTIADMKKESHEGKVELFQAEEAYQVKEKHLQTAKELAEKELNKVKKQLDAVQEQHVSQMQRLQESHARALSSRDQQSSAHRLQVKQLQENESRRIEELSRCRAQVSFGLSNFTKHVSTNVGHKLICGVGCRKIGI